MERRGHRLATDTENGMVVVISGPSGVGKTTITRAIERSIGDAVFSVSATTRPKTEADVEGVDYHFMDEGEFLERKSAGEFLETATYAGHRYGTLAEPVRAQLERGRLVILEIDVQGARSVRGVMGEAVFGVFILPPSEEALLERLRNRKREAEEVIARRYAEARREIEEAKRCGAYDAFVVNDDLERATEEALELVRGARVARAR